MATAATLDFAVRVETLDALLPQTQCSQCGYAGCRPYAEAMASGAADINRCPPGGTEVIGDLAQALNCKPIPLDTRCGVTQPPSVVIIDEAWCIGCTLCIQACPVDAIVGAAKVMHTVIAEACTGCALCIPPCPVDCIQVIEVTRPVDRASRLTIAAVSRERYRTRQQRLQLTAAAEKNTLNRTAKLTAGAYLKSETLKQSAVARALARARERLS